MIYMIQQGMTKKRLKRLSISSNAKLAQSGRHQSRTKAITGSIFSGGDSFDRNIIAISYISLYSPTLPVADP